MTEARENSRLGHVYRPGPFHRRRAYWLDGEALHWQIGRASGHVALRDIAGLRLDLTPGAGRCVLVESSGRRHRLSDRCWPGSTVPERHLWGRMERHETTFRGLSVTLARRLARINPQAAIETGPGRFEWIATCLVALLVLGIVLGGGGLMLAQGAVHLGALAFMALALVNLPMLWPVVRSGGPQRLDPAMLGVAGPETGQDAC